MIGGIYEVRRWDGLRCHDLYTKFHKDSFSHSKVDKGDYIDTQTEWWSHKPTLFFQNNGIIIEVDDDASYKAVTNLTDLIQRTKGKFELKML
jgi:hypothetical protein